MHTTSSVGQILVYSVYYFTFYIRERVKGNSDVRTLTDALRYENLTLLDRYRDFNYESRRNSRCH